MRRLDAWPEKPPREKPGDRAERLLREFLTPAQLKTWAEEGYFDVRGEGSGGYSRTYRVMRGRPYSLRRLSVTGVATYDRVWCLVGGRAISGGLTAPRAFPVADMALAKKLMVEAEGERALLGYPRVDRKHANTAYCRGLFR